MSKLEDIQKSLEEKAFLENQHVETIENQAQKIAELEVLVNDSKVKSNNQVVVKEESILKDDSPETDSEEQVQSNENEEIFSKCKLITSKSANSFMSDNSFEHFQYSDIHIVNVNLTRATMDMASTFNKFLQEIISKERNKIIVNLSDCEYIDSSILGVLVSSLKKAITLDGELKIVWRDQNEYSMFSLTKMDNIFRIFNNLKDAVNSFS
ncbi:MAG: STAS domain-containing protein [Ignavibacteria bacterium]|nr:STAS domain-containing protein [Ignavibacteria bacterium]